MYQAVFVLGSHFVSGQTPKLTFARTGRIFFLEPLPT